MVIDLLTLSPAYFISPLREGMVSRGIEKGLVRVRVFQLRDFTRDRHRTVDDRPYGGGAGMVLKPEPIARALHFLERLSPRGAYPVLLTPRGRPLDQPGVKGLAKKKRLILICGRYEGVDERIAAHYSREQISVGDYVLSGGEPAALTVLDAVVRLQPEVLGCADSRTEESHEDGILEYPQYTRPRSFEGRPVPEVLLTGHHEQVRKWRRREALHWTWKTRPGLIREAALNAEDRQMIGEIQKKPIH